MEKIAVVFSGQGAQKVGMCQDIYEKYDLAKKTFDCFSQIKNDLKQVCFESDEETLMKTINTQPCLYATQVAIFNVFSQIISQKNIKIEGFAGFSLGEIAALYASGVYSFDDGFKIVCQRASLMQMCADKTDGAMVACLKLTPEQINEIANSFENTFAVNYNSVAQTVVATKKENVDVFCSTIKENKGKAIPLAVNGGFHCPFMDEAAKGLNLFLNSENIDISSPKTNVYANKNGQVYPTQKKEIIETLSNQVNNPVFWQATIENMINDGFDTFIEIGAGKTLCGLIKKINSEVKTISIEDVESLETAIENL